MEESVYLDQSRYDIVKNGLKLDDQWKILP